MGRKMNLNNLSEEECEKILHVIERDFELRQRERDRLGQLEDRLKTEEDRAKLLTSRVTFNQSCCVRCCQVFGLIFNRRQQCFLCRFFVCKRCGTYSHEDKAFVCFACLEQREFRRRSCDWFYSSLSHKHKRFGSAKVVRSLYKRKSSSDTEFDSGYDPSQFSSLQLSSTKARPALGDVFDLRGEGDLAPDAASEDQELPLVASGSNGVSRPVSRASSLQSLLPASSQGRAPTPVALTATPNSLTSTPNSLTSTHIGHNASSSAFSARLEEKPATTKSRKTTKDVYHEAFEKAKKVEEARFKAKFDNLIADVRKSLEIQNPDLDITSSFGSTSYAEVMISFRSRLRELLVGHYQRLQLAYESFDVTQSENDHGPAVRKNVSVLVENLVGETLDLTSDEAVSDLSSLSEDSPPDQHSFADHIAQVIVAKILDSHRREVSRTISSEGHDDQEGHQNGLDLPDSGHERARTTTTRSHDDDDEEEDDDVSDVVRQFEELRNFAQASHPRPEPVARDIEERVSPSPVEEDPVEKVSVDKEEAQEDFLTRCQSFDRVRNSPGPDFSQFDALCFGSGEVDPDLLSMNLAIIPEETEEQLEQEDAEEGQWKENWIFKGAGFSPYDNCAARKIRTEDDRPLYMMVPQPDDNLIPRIGNRDADQLSDLSENEDGKSTDDLSDDENTFYSKTSEELRRISRKTATAVQTEESDLDSPRGLAARRDSGTQSTSSMVSRSVDVSLDSSLPLVDKPRLKLLEDLIPADNDDPKFVVPPESATILEGEVLKLSCKVAGTPSVGVFWYQETEEVEELEDGEDCDISSEGDRHTLTMYNLTRSKAGQFMCIALNDAGKCTKYFSVTVKENKQDLKAPEFIKGLQDVEVREGQSVKFRCKVKGIPLPRITWYKDGRLLRSSRSCRLEKFGNRDYILSLDSATMEDDAEYSVVARNIRGEARSSAQVIVEPAQEVATTSSRLTSTKTSLPEDSLDRLTRRMSEERDRMAETASSLLGTAEELTSLNNGLEEVDRHLASLESDLHQSCPSPASLSALDLSLPALRLQADMKSAKSVRLLTSSALDVLRAAEEIIQSEKEDSGKADFVTSTPRAPPSPTSSRRDVINNNDVTDSLLGGMTSIEGDTTREDSVLYLTGSTLEASSTDGLVFGSSRDHSAGARVGLRLPTDERAEDRLASGQRIMGGESSLDTSVADADTSADLSLSDFALRPEDFSGEEVLNFGPKPVDPKRYRRDYEVPRVKESEEAESQRHWEVKMNAFSPQAEIINRREATNSAEEKIYMAAGRVFGLEDRVRELEDRVADCDPSEQELSRLEKEVARAVAQAAQSEREVSSITLSVSELQQQQQGQHHMLEREDNSSQASTPRQSVDSGFSSLREKERPAPVVMVGHSGEGDVPASRGEYNLEEGVELPSVHRLRAMFSQKTDPDLGDGSFLRVEENPVHSITARSLAKAQQQQQQQQQQGGSGRERTLVHAGQMQARSTAQLQLSLPPSPPSPGHSPPSPGFTEPPSGPGLPRTVLRRSQVGADSSSFQPLEPEKNPVLIYPRSSSKSHPAPSPPQASMTPTATPTPSPRHTVTATTSRTAPSQSTSSKAATRTAPPAASSSTPSASSSTPSTSSSTPSAESAGATASAGAGGKKTASPRIRSGCISARAAFWEKRISEGNMSDCSVAEEFPDVVEDDSSESQA